MDRHDDAGFPGDRIDFLKKQDQTGTGALLAQCSELLDGGLHASRSQRLSRPATPR